MQFLNGNKYIGSWKDDVQHGVGIYFDMKDSVKKQGEWRNGRRTTWLSKPIRINGENT